jgi:hypothetical protein
MNRWSYMPPLNPTEFNDYCEELSAKTYTLHYINTASYTLSLCERNRLCAIIEARSAPIRKLEHSVSVREDVITLLRLLYTASKCVHKNEGLFDCVKINTKPKHFIFALSVCGAFGLRFVSQLHFILKTHSTEPFSDLEYSKINTILERTLTHPDCRMRSITVEFGTLAVPVRFVRILCSHARHLRVLNLVLDNSLPPDRTLFSPLTSPDCTIEYLTVRARMLPTQKTCSIDALVNALHYNTSVRHLDLTCAHVTLRRVYKLLAVNSHIITLFHSFTRLPTIRDILPLHNASLTQINHTWALSKHPLYSIAERNHYNTHIRDLSLRHRAYFVANRVHTTLFIQRHIPPRVLESMNRWCNIFSNLHLLSHVAMPKRTQPSRKRALNSNIV